MQERKVWVWEGGIWWKADGALLLKATSPMRKARWDWCCGLDPEPLDSTATTAGLKLIRLRGYSKHLQRSHTGTATVVAR